MGTRIIFRDLQRKTVACDACRSRKQKCEGLSPCSFCATKGIQCVFQEQLKRGRKKQIHAEEDSQLSTPNLVKENMLFGTAEIRNHLEFALKLDMSAAFLNYEDLISPRTTAIEVQTYAIAAVSAQTREQHGSSTVYAAKARSLVGSVFDIPDIDAVMAITFVSYYWKRNLDIRLSTHYTSVAWSLLKLVANPDPIRSSICLHTYLVAGGEVNVDHSIIEQYAFSHLDTFRARITNMQLNPTEKAYFEIQCHCITLYAKLLNVFGHKIISPQDKETIFLPMDSIIVSEEARSKIIPELVKIERCTILLGEYAGVHAIYGLVVRIHHAIVEWKSGHLMEAMVQAKLCLEIANALKEYNAIDLLSDFAHLCNLGSLVQFFCSQRCYQYAFEICEYIKYLCVKLGPSYNLLEGIVDKYVSQNIEIHLSSSTTTCTTTSTTTSAASSSSRIEYCEDADSLDISSIPSPFSISNLFNRDSNDDIESDDN